MARDALVENLFAHTQALHRAWRAYFQKVLGSEGVSLVQMGILLHIKHHQPVSGKQIAAAMQMSPSSVTQLIDCLDQMDFIEREHDRQDRRIVYVSLSETGKTKTRVLEAKRRRFFVEVTATLSDQEITAMTAMQQKMAQQIERGRANEKAVSGERR